MSLSWGQHVILNAGMCCRRSIRSSQEITKFSAELVKRIDMVAYGPPWVKHFGSGNKAGFTLVQLIETSNIVAHFVEETDDMYLDVFSCKPFNPSTVEAVVRSYFQPQFVEMTSMQRLAPRGRPELLI